MPPEIEEGKSEAMEEGSSSSTPQSPPWVPLTCEGLEMSPDEHAVFWRRIAATRQSSEEVNILQGKHCPLLLLQRTRKK